MSRFHVQRAKEGTIPLPFSGNRAEKRSHNLGNALGEGLGLLKNEYASTIIFLNSRKDRRKDEVFFVRCRRTYILNNFRKEYICVMKYLSKEKETFGPVYIGLKADADEDMKNLFQWDCKYFSSQVAD